jgi:hypothetical protein
MLQVLECSFARGPLTQDQQFTAAASHRLLEWRKLALDKTHPVGLLTHLVGL